MCSTVMESSTLSNITIGGITPWMFIFKSFSIKYFMVLKICYNISQITIKIFTLFNWIMCHFLSCPQQMLLADFCSLHYIFWGWPPPLTEWLCFRSHCVEVTFLFSLDHVSTIKVSCVYIIHTILAKFIHLSWDHLIASYSKWLVYEWSSNHIIMLVCGWFFHICCLNHECWSAISVIFVVSC